MSKSLYEQYGVVASGSGPDPGTLHTAQIETVDNDIVGMHGAALSVLSGPSAATGGDDCTTDRSPLRLSDPRPRPGSAYTATIETSDEDAAGALSQIGAEWAAQRPY